MKRPAIYILIYILIGIFFGINFNLMQSFYAFLFISVTITAIIMISFKKYLFILLLPIAFLGLYIGISSSSSTNIYIDNFADTSENIAVQAVVNDVIKEYDEYTKYSITSQKLITSEYKANDRINMYLYTSERLMLGDVVKFESKLRHGNIKRNESDFNEELYFKTKKIKYKVFSDEVLVCGKTSSLQISINKISEKIQSIIYNIYNEKDAGIITAMVIGDKTGLDSKIYETYRQAGIVHIIAISGLHISILATILLFLLKPFGRYVPPIILLIFLAFYSILTGCSVSIVRASIMMLFYIMGGLISRRYDILSSAAVTCCILLCYNPYYIYDLGFQYSFISVFAIGLTTEILNKYNIKNKFIALFIISLAVSLATKPITMYNFYYINSIDVFLNVIVLFIMQIMMPLILISVVAGFIYIKLGLLVGTVVHLLLNIIEYLSEITLKIPLSYIMTGGASILIIITLYLIIISVYKILIGKKYTIPLLLICILFIAYTNISKYTGFQADFIYVGQGDCTILRENDKCFLIDCGSSEYRPYGQTILNELSYNNVKKINGIYISHLDYDHMGGIIEIADFITIENIYIGSNFIENENYYMLLDAASKNNINIEYIDIGHSNKISENSTINLIYFDTNCKNTNESSAIFKLISGNKSILFTGDINSKISDTLVKFYDISADILKVPHHGSKYSNSYGFINAVNPRLAINFAGYNNVYGHPNIETIDLYENSNIPFLSTNYDGMVKIRIKDNNIYYKLLDTRFEYIN